MPEWIISVLLVAANAAMWFWLGRDSGKSAVHKTLADNTFEIKDGDAKALEGAPAV